ncbi:Major Facilitator Superfamily protein [Metschnikowia aff. pulcherrima]|uniref:Major Facilitator Superfamily protein n=1 Tax=Metschnikowia aff. pulcherrima TaxID=2163413 RepID=A0A4P6XQJ4_9ASCO|nr:Major Facilitator Superfamily protein [Metschnikowia aff. pulcherrima]
MSFLKEPLSRLKWGFIPVRRIVDEDPDTPEDAEAETKISLQDSNYEDAQKTDEVESLEYRDEANRPWWKFFDEYEYRVNKQTRQNHKWYKWFDENDTPAERKLMWKIDILLTLYSLIAYWAKYLDQTNLNNAYVAGLKESLDMKGNDLVDTQVLFSIGNIVFQLPFIYVLNGLPLNYVLPLLDICWSAFTIGTYKVTSLAQLKALRFLVGTFEAPIYLSYMYLFGTFIFNPAMIARRTMVFYFGQFLGILTSGLLSGAIVRAFEGIGGLEAWRWIFIIDGIISIAVGVLGFYMLPGTPTDCYSIWMSDDEIRLLRRKLKQNHTAGRPQVNLFTSLFSMETWKLILTSWEIYVLAVWNILVCNNNNGASGAYILWLKSLNRFDAGSLQDYSALTPGLGLVWLLLTCMYADMFQLRCTAIWLSQAFNITGNVILAVWNVPERAKWFAWCLQYFGWAMAPVLYSWQSDICRRDAQKRAVVLVIMNLLGLGSTAWMSVIVWRTVEAPRFLKGYSFTAASAFGLCIWTLVVMYFYRKQERKYARQNGIVLYNSITDPEPIHIEEVESSGSEEKKPSKERIE